MSVDSVEPHRRSEWRRVLINMESKIESLPIHRLSADKLEEMNVTVQSMALDEESDIKPSFFAPYPSFPEPDDVLLERMNAGLESKSEPFDRPIDCANRIEHYLSSYTYHWTYGEVMRDIPWSSKDVGDYTPYKDLYQYHEPQFGAYRMTDITGSEYPHTKAVIYNDLDGNNQEWFRGEVLIILRLMLGQLNRRCFIRHMFAPVLLFSLMGTQHARAIEAYFDGHLVLRSTELYDFHHTNGKTFKAFAEWYLGPPVGKTVDML